MMLVHEFPPVLVRRVVCARASSAHMQAKIRETRSDKHPDKMSASILSFCAERRSAAASRYILPAFTP
jgi:hypothetical protein